MSTNSIKRANRARLRSQCAKESHAYILTCLLLGLLAACADHQAARAPAPDPYAALLADLRGGGYIIYLRHAETATASESTLHDFADCSCQRNLNEHGREQAALVGARSCAVRAARGRTFCHPSDRRAGVQPGADGQSRSPLYHVTQTMPQVAASPTTSSKCGWALVRRAAAISCWSATRPLCATPREWGTRRPGRDRQAEQRRHLPWWHDSPSTGFTPTSGNRQSFLPSTQERSRPAVRAAAWVSSVNWAAASQISGKVRPAIRASSRTASSGSGRAEKRQELRPPHRPFDGRLLLARHLEVARFDLLALLIGLGDREARAAAGRAKAAA